MFLAGLSFSIFRRSVEKKGFAETSDPASGSK